MGGLDAQSAKKKEQYKKLIRKIRRAKRLNEPYGLWLNEANRLDEFLSNYQPGWIPGGHHQYGKDQ